MTENVGIISPELHFIIENTNDLMFVKDKDSVYVAASKNYALQCVRCNEVEDIIGKNDLELYEDQSIAKKYREDDKILLESGKTMMEFQEEFQDLEGKKHDCMVTKYLLRDQDGNPVAIFGQYHHIGEKVTAERACLKKIQRRITETLGRSLFTIIYIELQENKFQIIRSTDYGRKMLENCKTLEEAFTAFFHTLVDSEYYAQMYEFCDMTTINERIKGEKQIACEYFSAMVKGWCRTSFYPMEWDEKGEVTQLLFTVSSIDALRAQDIEDGISIKRNQDALFDVVPLGIALYEWDGKKIRFLNTNQRYRDMFEYGDLSKEDSPTFKPIHPDDLEGYRKVIKKALKETQHLEYAFRNWNKEEQCYRWVQINAVAKPLKNGHSIIYAIFTDIMKQKRLEQSNEELYQKYKYNSEHDGLTGLYNRNRVFEKCRELLTAHPEEQFVMLHCDIRHFHLYNTFFGEEEGNCLLCKIADLISNMGWEYDDWAYGRIESDVFCTFFPINQGDFEEHVRYFFRALKNFRNDFPLTPAMGIYWVTDPKMSIEEMFSYATIAAKSRKINLYGLISYYDEEMERNLKDTQQITSEMHAAIEQEQFEVYLQPKYSLSTDRMAGAEALVRWNHPKRGMISPGKFIPAFENNGFISTLDQYMWEHVCRILYKWQKERKRMYPVSVNISRVSMYNHSTVSFLKSLIEKYQLDPKYLELELTESAYMDEPEDLKQMLQELREYGFKILMDDFGSGYSSLNMLRDLPVDVLKLDMKFLTVAQNDARGNAVLSSVVKMSKLLNLPIVAEGVETQEQADYLSSIGCDYVQGFLYARPMPTADYEVLLSQCESDFDESVEETAREDEVCIANLQLKNSHKIEDGLLGSLKKLVVESELNASSDSIVQEVLDYYDADRAYIFEFDWTKNIVKNTHEIYASNAKPMADSLRQLPIAAFETWTKAFHENALFRIEKQSEFGKENHNENAVFIPDGVESLIAAPVYFEGQLVGLLGVDNPKCNLENATFLTNLAFFGVNIASHEKEIAESELKSMLDPLTGAYNKKGYDTILSQYESDRRSMAYIQLDIDHFKKLSNIYGHAFCDELLQQVVIQLKNVFRSDDYVFHFDGNEFAVLLTNCMIDEWHTISDKQRMMHIRLNQVLKKDVYVTLSMGIGWSKTGFKEGLEALADAALYQAKSNGRSGCCVFDLNHKTIFEWKDDIGDDSRSSFKTNLWKNLVN